MVMSSAQARVVDPILTTVAQGYQNNELVAQYLFPVVPVGQRGGKIIQFGKEDFRLYNTGRTPGANTKRVQYGYQGTPYALEEHSLEGSVPFELMQEANAVPGIDMGRNAVGRTQNIILLKSEVDAAAIARDAANYVAANKVTLAGTSQWSDHANGVSDPSGDIETAKEAIRAATGKRPNVVLLSPKAYNACKQHPKIIDRIKYTGRDSVTADMLATLWDVKKVVVGDGIYEDQAGGLTDVWGKDVVVAYTEMGSLADAGLPSYGYTYRLSGYPLVETPYMDRNAKLWAYPVNDSRSPVLAASGAGYLITNVSA
ncbi:MAG: major capsid protein [Gallionella sp.]